MKRLLSFLAFKPVVHNVRPATSPDVARDLSQENQLFQSRIQWIRKVAHLIN